MKENDIERFFPYHTNDYPQALAEIRAGHKESHWIWYIFPQLKGLGVTPRSELFGIKDAEEAREYLSHPVLGADLAEISGALLGLDETDPVKVMGRIDALKLRSCMTLFASVSEGDSVYHRVLAKYYGGEMDGETLRMLGRQ
ncbi:MAG: DUF1810 domain-containing protein [Synergistaceae bacterium]|nr:DUF1810 domain-containing protein [Synergistaceae bacterium]